jgi:uncharacterized cupredoxin-like copper-binding protein
MPGRSALPFATLLAGVVLLASACSLPDLAGAGSERPGPDGRAARPNPVSPGPPRAPRPTWVNAGPVRVVMNDRFRYRPAAIIVRAGRRVTFVVSNAGKLPHEFILGDRTTQLAHEQGMQQPPGGHVHDHGPGAGALTVPPGATRRLSWTFDEPGMVLYGCHVLGHWAAGMKGTITVVAPDRPLSR